MASNMASNMPSNMPSICTVCDGDKSLGMFSVHVDQHCCSCPTENLLPCLPSQTLATSTPTYSNPDCHLAHMGIDTDGDTYHDLTTGDLGDLGLAFGSSQEVGEYEGEEEDEDEDEAALPS